MTIDSFVHKHPHVFHIAATAAIPQILTHGLLSTRAILDLLGHEPEAARNFLRTRRLKAESLCGVAGNFRIRDQIPLPEKGLQSCLDSNLKPADWYELLNSRVFFWVNRDRVLKLRETGLASKESTSILTFDSRALLNDFMHQASVSIINGGYALRRPAKRGLSTYVPLEQYEPVRSRRKMAELTVEYAVPNVEKYLAHNID